MDYIDIFYCIILYQTFDNDSITPKVYYIPKTDSKKEG